MTEDQLKQFLEDERESIAASIKARMVETMTSNVSWTLNRELQTAVDEFFTAEIVPEIKAHLAEQKGPIVAAAIKASAEIGDLVAQKMVAQAVESMTSYRSKDVISALMGVR